jgi:hypothetical protein
MMTDLGTEPTAPSHKDAKAQAKAAKAYAKATRPWFKKKRVMLPLATVAIIAMAAANSGGDDSSPAATAGADSKQESSGSDEAATSSEAAGLNEAVRDGKFEFTVKKVDCGETRIGNATFGTKAQGQFCLVNLKVENIGNEAQSMFGDNQLLFDQDGREFSADTEAAMYMGDKAQTLWEEINPGNSINGVVVFDVPKNAVPTSIELHDSMFSDGVKVSLKK